MPTAKAEQAARTRQRVLLAAAEVFDEAGYEKASVTQIVERAGLTLGALYFHFGSKQGLAEAARTGRWQLRADQDHLVLFDHPVDHAPGMLLLEALRQAAHAVSPTTDSTVTGMSVSFQGWVELDAPAWVSVAPLRRNRLKAVIEQEDKTCLSGEVVIEADPARALERPSPMPSHVRTVDGHAMPDGWRQVIPTAPRC